jgi:hypothetical protein
MGTSIDNIEARGYLPEESISKKCSRELLKIKLITGGLPKIHNYDKFLILEENYSLSDLIEELDLNSKETSDIEKWLATDIKEVYNNLKKKFYEKTGVEIETMGYSYRTKFHKNDPKVDLEGLTNRIYFVTYDIDLIPRDLDYYLFLLER